VPICEAVKASSALPSLFRALIHSRKRVGMERYSREFPNADVVLFEPAQDDEVIFFANMFSYADRRALAEHAYRHTLSELKRRAHVLVPVFARHGVEFDFAALRGDERPPSKPSQTGKLWDSVQPLGKTLGELEMALSRDKPGRSEGVKRDAEAAPPDA
jgi:NTE family protein